MNWNQEHRRSKVPRKFETDKRWEKRLSKELDETTRSLFEMAERMTAGTLRLDRVLTLKQQLVTKGFLTKAQWSFVKKCMVVERE